MDIPNPERGTLRTLKNLRKDSIIAVTIDDLNEGLIVVSFSHEGNLYQGVLLQLNRERGIPSGISFPKDYCTGSVVEPLGENDPTQVPPLPQRHTYFQDKDGSLADPMKSRLALRRVIKPPARFKNSRMSLRLRSRPILCAKCRTLCEDKVSSQSSDTQEDAELSKKIISTAGGVTTRRGKSTMGVTLNSNIPSSTQESESTQDYSYVSVGSKSFIENYWKRPSLLPTPDEKVGRSTSSTPLSSGQGGVPKPPTESTVVVKSVPKMPKINTSCMNENKLTLTLTKDNNNKVLPKLLVSSNPGFEKTVKIKKSKNFKAYKAKLLNNSSSPDQTEKPVVEPRDPSEIPEERLGDPNVAPTTSTLPELSLEPVDVGLKDDLSANSNKMWENRIRKKSTVPARFRDEGYLTKNIFSFKRRRVEDEAVGEGESPEHRLLPFEESDQEMAEKESSKLSPVETSSSSDVSRNSATPTFPLPPVVGSIGGTNGHADTKLEPAKTPVIKISFGTPGNGVVVEIPPKAKIEETGSLTDKAARKAMKKAKKEARRKLSLSREPSPSAKHALPQTPSPPAPNPECALVPACVEPDPMTPELKPDVNLLEPYHVSKKKKKEKKKKRSKPTKDNCDSTTVGHGGITPPHEDSSENYERISPSPDQPTSTGLLGMRIPPDSPEPPVVDDDGDKCTEDSPESKTGCSTASSTEAPQRLCISLKRLNDNSMVSWDITQSCITCSHNELDSGEPEQVGSPTSSEPNDYPMNDSPSSEQRNANASSIDSYTDECRNYMYKKGDIIWGKLPGCPWWPGKILDILFVDVDDVTAKVSWYRASTLSCIRFSQLGPFAEQFESRYTRSRKRGSYQHAVRDALIEAHQLDPNDLPSD